MAERSKVATPSSGIAKRKKRKKKKKSGKLLTAALYSATTSVALEGLAKYSLFLKPPSFLIELWKFTVGTMKKDRSCLVNTQRMTMKTYLK